jgi:hypothetical protein
MGTTYYYIIDYGAFTADESTAVLELTLGRFGFVYTDDMEYSYLEPNKVNVTFQKTSDGWRISGGTMFSLLYGDTYTETEPSPSPETGDATPTVVFIAFISLAVCGYTALKKRRS